MRRVLVFPKSTDTEDYKTIVKGASLDPEWSPGGNSFLDTDWYPEGYSVNIVENDSVTDDADTDHDDFKIDEEEYLVVCSIFAMSGIPCEVRENDEDQRIRQFCGQKLAITSLSIEQLEHLQDLDLAKISLTALPDEIGELSNLEGLSLENSEIQSLPPSIGRLKKLKFLQLRDAWSLTSLPEEIGELSNLITLDLGGSLIQALPPSIGRLKKLAMLDLRLTCLTSLPEEIGELASLESLSLFESDIQTLPSSIRGLQKLETLNICWAKEFAMLPNEIGELTSLKELGLGGTNIRELPPSIGELKDLQILDLSYTENLTKVPESIGDLANLEVLDVERSGITSLPRSLERLKSLKFLDVFGTRIPALRQNGPAVQRNDDFIMALVKRLPSLGSVGTEMEASNGLLTEEGRRKIFYAMACNRVRFQSPLLTPKLWPFLLNNAARTDQKYHIVLDHFGDNYNYRLSRIEQPDAIYLLLQDDMETLLGIISIARKCSRV